MEFELKHDVNFIGEPKLQPSSNGHKFELIDVWNVFLNQKMLTIDMGFWTDLASTGWLSPLNESLKAAVLHDYLYYKQVYRTRPLKRKDADLFFLQAMIECKFNKFLAYSYYYGVRIGGWKPWNKYKNDRIKNKGVKNEN